MSDIKQDMAIASILSGVYCIRNKSTKRFYVGKATSAYANAKARWNSHMVLLKNGNHFSRLMQKDHACYGRDSFELLMLEEIGIPGYLAAQQSHDEVQKMISDREKFWIARLSPEYNRAHATESSPVQFLDEISSLRKVVFSGGGRGRRAIAFSYIRQ